MKTLATAIRSTLLVSAIALLAPSVHAGSYIRDAAAICKAEAEDQFGSAENPVRVKFKTAMGNRLSPRVLLEVLPGDADSFKAMCHLDGKSGEVISLTRKS